MSHTVSTSARTLSSEALPAKSKGSIGIGGLVLIALCGYGLVQAGSAQAHCNDHVSACATEQANQAAQTANAYMDVAEAQAQTATAAQLQEKAAAELRTAQGRLNKLAK